MSAQFELKELVSTLGKDSQSKTCAKCDEKYQEMELQKEYQISLNEYIKVSQIAYLQHQKIKSSELIIYQLKQV